MAKEADLRQFALSRAALSFPLDEAGEQVFAAFSAVREDGTIMAHLEIASRRGSAGSGVPLEELATCSHQSSGGGFLDDGRYCLDRSLAAHLDSAQTERLIHWARLELGLLDLSLGPRQRLSPLAG
jgi:hypothetical protein